MDREVILDIRDIHTYYQDSYILQGVSLKIPERNTVVLLGRNGAGKTTLTRSIIGFTPPRRGKVTFKGHDLANLSPNQIAKLGIGLVPQGRRLFSSLTVLENLIVAARTKNRSTWTLERIFDLFPRLKERASQPSNKLSGGEQQMLCISRALMGNPDLFLMDEPTEGLAPLLVSQLKGVLLMFKEYAMSVLLVEQNLKFALAVADYMYGINVGKIVYEYSPEEFRQNQETIYRFMGL